MDRQNLNKMGLKMRFIYLFILIITACGNSNSHMVDKNDGKRLVTPVDSTKILRLNDTTYFPAESIFGLYKSSSLSDSSIFQQLIFITNEYYLENLNTFFNSKKMVLTGTIYLFEEHFMEAREYYIARDGTDNYQWFLLFGTRNNMDIEVLDSGIISFDKNSLKWNGAKINRVSLVNMDNPQLSLSLMSHGNIPIPCDIK